MREFDRDADVWVLEGTFPSVYGGSGVMDVGCARLRVANRPITYHPSLSRCLFVLGKGANSSGTGGRTERVGR